jgi:uncharacterized membrane protein
MALRLVKRLFRQLRTNVITGVLLLIPLFVTILIIVQLFQWIDSALPGIIGIEMAPGLGVLITIVIAYFTGLTAKNYVGKKIIDTGNHIISNIPILNKIYLTIQQIVDVVSLNKKRLFERAVLIEYPKENCYSIAFVTSEHNTDFSMKAGQKLTAVFLPTTPNPTSGYLLYVADSDMIEINIPVETAIKLVMSGGLISADHAAKMQATLPVSKRSWNWMDIFKKKGHKDNIADPRD